jgi:serine/threonine protein kinase
MKLMHRDLKPENIFIKNGIPKIADFGCSKIYKKKMTNKTKNNKNSIGVGAQGYMAP